MRNRYGESISEGTLHSSLGSEGRGGRKPFLTCKILSLNKDITSTHDLASCLDYLEGLDRCGQLPLLRQATPSPTPEGFMDQLHVFSQEMLIRSLEMQGSKPQVAKL